MKFCISNLAWNIHEEVNVLNLLKRKIKYLEYSPSLLISDPASKKDALKAKIIWEKRKISLYSMQSILFNSNNAYIFGNIKQRQNFYDQVKKKIILAKAPL